MKRPEKEDYFKNWTQNINLLHQDKDRYIESLEKYIDYLEQQEVSDESRYKIERNSNDGAYWIDDKVTGRNFYAGTLADCYAWLKLVDAKLLKGGNK